MGEARKDAGTQGIKLSIFAVYTQCMSVLELFLQIVVRDESRSQAFPPSSF